MKDQAKQETNLGSVIHNIYDKIDYLKRGFTADFIEADGRHQGKFRLNQNYYSCNSHKESPFIAVLENRITESEKINLSRTHLDFIDPETVNKYFIPDARYSPHGYVADNLFINGEPRKSTYTHALIALNYEPSYLVLKNLPLNININNLMIKHCSLRSDKILNFDLCCTSLHDWLLQEGFGQDQDYSPWNLEDEAKQILTTSMPPRTFDEKGLFINQNSDICYYEQVFLIALSVPLSADQFMQVLNRFICALAYLHGQAKIKEGTFPILFNSSGSIFISLAYALQYKFNDNKFTLPEHLGKTFASRQSKAYWMEYKNKLITGLTCWKFERTFINRVISNESLYSLLYILYYTQRLPIEGKINLLLPAFEAHGFGLVKDFCRIKLTKKQEYSPHHVLSLSMSLTDEVEAMIKQLKSSGQNETVRQPSSRANKSDSPQSMIQSDKTKVAKQMTKSSSQSHRDAQETIAFLERELKYLKEVNKHISEKLGVNRDLLSNQSSRGSITINNRFKCAQAFAPLNNESANVPQPCSLITFGEFCLLEMRNRAVHGGFNLNEFKNHTLVDLSQIRFGWHDDQTKAQIYLSFAVERMIELLILYYGGYNGPMLKYDRLYFLTDLNQQQVLPPYTELSSKPSDSAFYTIINGYLSDPCWRQ